METVKKANKNQKITNDFKGMFDTTKKSYITDRTNTQVPLKVKNYKDIKNYIHNYLGLTKEEIRSIFKEVLDKTIKDEVQKIMNDREGLKCKIEESIVKEIRRQDNNERHSWPVSIMDDIYHKIDKTIHEEVTSRLLVELKEPEERKADFNYILNDMALLSLCTKCLYSESATDRDKETLYNQVSMLIDENSKLKKENTSLKFKERR